MLIEGLWFVMTALAAAAARAVLIRCLVAAWQHWRRPNPGNGWFHATVSWR